MIRRNKTSGSLEEVNFTFGDYVKSGGKDINQTKGGVVDSKDGFQFSVYAGMDQD